MHGQSLSGEIENDNVIKLKDEFDKLCRTAGTSKVVLDIYNFEENHSQKILHDYGRGVHQFELYYDTLINLINGINYIDKTSWPKHRAVQFLLVVHNLKSLFSSFQRLIKGFYEDSIILERPVYESFIKIVYISCYPDKPYETVIGKNFNLTGFLKDKLKLNWHDYKTFSAISHSNSYSVLDEANKLSKADKPELISLKFKYDEKLFTLSLNYINFLILIYLKITLSLFTTSYHKRLSKDLISKTKKLIELREENFIEHPKNYWPQVITDVRDIITMLDIIEKDKNSKWQEVWVKIRKINTKS